MNYGRATLGGRHQWDHFEEAVYEYAQECVFIELQKKGYVEPPRDDIWWAYEYLPAFFERFDEEECSRALVWTRSTSLRKPNTAS